jgi:uncharacterized repeat protein (TIGR03803 family)
MERGVNHFFDEGAKCANEVFFGSKGSRGFDPYGEYGGNGPLYMDPVRDKKGNLYGTTYLGGTYNVGRVFKVSSTGKGTILHNFKGPDGAYPWAGLVEDGEGNFYGTTTTGGDLNCQAPYGCGTVFKLIPHFDSK